MKEKVGYPLRSAPANRSSVSGLVVHPGAACHPKLTLRRKPRVKDGGPDGSRTRDLMNAIHARSQLRYWPTGVSVTLNRSAQGWTRQQGHDLPVPPLGLAASSDGNGPEPASGSAGPPPLQGSRRRTASRLSASRPGVGVAPATCCQPASLQSDRDVRRYRVGSDERSQKSLSCLKTEAQILRGRYVESSEARREDRVHMLPKVNRLAIWKKKNLCCQLLHRFCTIHAQVFHNGEAKGLFEPRTDQRVE